MKSEPLFNIPNVSEYIFPFSINVPRPALLFLISPRSWLGITISRLSWDIG